MPSFGVMTGSGAAGYGRDVGCIETAGRRLTFRVCEEPGTVTTMDVSEFVAVLHTEPPVADLTAIGELDAFTSRQLSHQVDRAVDAGCTTLRLHLGGLTFIDAA